MRKRDKKWERMGYRKYMCFLLMTVLLMAGNHMGYSQGRASDYVDVGLIYGANNEYPVGLVSDQGFQFGMYAGANFVSLVDLSNYTQVTAYKDGFFTAADQLVESYEAYYQTGRVKGGYHLVIGSSYPTYDAIVNDYIMYKSVDPNVYVVCDDGWKLAVGNYLTAAQAQADISKYASAFSSQSIQVMTPNRNRVMIYSGETPLIAYDSLEDEYVLKTTIFEMNQVKYRNAVKILRKSSSDFTVINRLTMSEYLYGVLPKEMSGDWPIEALKAQAVTARNFVYTSGSKHADLGFDVCSTTDCQVYGGYSVEKPLSNQAVDATKGIGLYYEGQLASCFYHSNSGGETDNIADIWSGDLPYVVGVSDPFSIGSPNTTWTLTLSVSEIEQKLAAGGYSIGSLQDIRISEKTSHGRVTKLDFVGSAGTASLLKEKARSLFGYTSLKSMSFSFKPSYVDIAPTDQSYVDASKSTETVVTSRGDVQETIIVMSSQGMSEISAKALSAMSSTGINTASGTVTNDGYSIGSYVTKRTTETSSTGQNTGQSTVTVPTSSTGTSAYGLEQGIDLSSGQVTFYGRGYGHGLGMSQWGAKKMAEMGYTYQQILGHYFQNTYVNTITQ